MINRIYDIVLFISNNELRGNVTPQEFNLALYNSMIETYDGYFYELNRLVGRQNRGYSGTDFAELPDLLREKIRHYLTKENISIEPLVGSVDLPKNLRYIDGVFYRDLELDSVTNSRQFEMIRKYPELLADEFPVYIQSGKELSFLPTTLEGTLLVWYLRNPLRPNWTYMSFGGNELYNPDADDFQDVDMHYSEEADLIKKVLLKMGINLKEQDLAGYMMAQENQQSREQNSI